MLTTVPPAVVPDDGVTALMMGVMPPRAGDALRARAAALARRVTVRRRVMGGSGAKDVAGGRAGPRRRAIVPVSDT